MMNKINAIVDIIDNWETHDLVTAWNERCEEQDLYDERIEDMYSFDELYDGMKPTEIADMLHNASFSTGDDYFEFNRHGNISSFSYVSDSDWFDMDELAEFIAENGLRNVDIDELIDELTDTFIEEHFEDDDIDDDTIKDIICENDYSVLSDDWDELETLIRECLSGDKDGEDDDE
jgi:hypothetical protein